MTNNDTPNIYSDFPEEYAALASEHEAHVKASLSEGSAALRVQLPAVLKDFQEAALALLTVVTTHQSGSHAVFTPEFIRDLLGKQLATEADIACHNAAVRVENAQVHAAKRWKEAVDAARRRQVWSAAQ